MKIVFTRSLLNIFGMILLCSFFVPPCGAKEARYKDISFEVRTNESIVISGFRGSVKVSPSADQMATLRVRKVLSDKVANNVAGNFDKWAFGVKREDSVIRFEIRGPDSKMEWMGQMQKVLPEFHIELELPSIPVSISWREGSVNVLNWKNALGIMMVEGSIRTQKTEGILRVEVQSGEVGIDGHRGRLYADSYQAKMNIQNLDGDLQGENFIGESVMQNAKGNLQWKSFQGNTTVTKSSGSIDFDNGKGNFNLASFEGPIRGQTDEGVFSAQVEGDPDLSLESNSGSVSVKVPASAGGLVRLQTEEGNLVAHDYLKLNKFPTMKSISGRLRGTSKGSISIKTKTGGIRLR